MSSDTSNIDDEDEESEGPLTVDEEDSSDVDGMGEPFSDDKQYKSIFFCDALYTTS